MQPERRPASAAEFIGFLVAAAQAAGGLTLALLVVRDGGAGADPSATGGSALLLVLGVLFGVLGGLVGLCAWLSLRRSLGARFGLVGAEVVFGVVGFIFLPPIGALVAATAVVVVLLMTVFSRLGRVKAAPLQA